jgi:DNA polymerase (family X)
MPVHNADMAAIFDEIADLLEIQQANPFRIRAYRNAARIVNGFGRDIGSLLRQGATLPKLPGIGADLAAKIREIAETGKCAMLARLRRELPPAVTALLKVPGLGPKRVNALYHDLGVQTLEQLYSAAREGRIRTLHGFGEKIEHNIQTALAMRAGQPHRFLLAAAAGAAAAISAYLQQTPGVGQVIVAGSFRRMRETVGDLDILATAQADSAAMTRFIAYDEIGEILSHGPTRASALLRSGLQVDIRVVDELSYGAALHYFTGARAHVIAVRKLAQARGLKINEYGVFQGQTRIAGDTEESVYRSVGLPYIPPELREDRGELEIARAGLLPHLITLADLRGDLHAHTIASDGSGTLREMAQAASDMGLEYLAITEHSRPLHGAHGLNAEQLLLQMEEIDRLNETLHGITLLKGVEVDILEDGSLDLPDSVLARLDLVIGAVHSHFGLSRKKQTERIVRAMAHPHFTLLAHPCGRLIGQRDACDVDMQRIILAAKQRGCYLELDAQPERMDLPDIHCRMAKEEGVLVSVDSDAHGIQDFGNLYYGIGQARRGWLQKQDVLNTRSLQALRPLLAATMS